MRRFSEEMDRLFEDFGFGSCGLTPSFGRGSMSDFGEFGRGLWSPQIETFEREGQLVIRADLPGLSKDDVNVELNDDAITISGERHTRMRSNAKVTIVRSAATAASIDRYRCRRA
jgi:HSP20 family protein